MLTRQDLRQRYPTFASAPPSRAPVKPAPRRIDALPWLVSIALACAVLAYL